MNLLSFPFGIESLLVHWECTITQNDAFSVSKSRDHGFNVDKSVDQRMLWEKSEIECLVTDDNDIKFDMSEIKINVSIEILSLFYSARDEIFRNNWSLYGIIMNQDENNINKSLTSFGEDEATFSFNFMIAKLNQKIDDLTQELNASKKMGEKRIVQNESKYMINDDDEEEAEKVKFWLSSTVGLPRYYPDFVENGFNSLDMIKEINNENDLMEIGITMKAHKLKIMNKINQLKQN